MRTPRRAPARRERCASPTSVRRSVRLHPTFACRPFVRRTTQRTAANPTHFAAQRASARRTVHTQRARIRTTTAATSVPVCATSTTGLVRTPSSARTAGAALRPIPRKRRGCVVTPFARPLSCARHCVGIPVRLAETCALCARRPATARSVGPIRCVVRAAGIVRRACSATAPASVVRRTKAGRSPVLVVRRSQISLARPRLALARLRVPSTSRRRAVPITRSRSSFHRGAPVWSHRLAFTTSARGSTGMQG